MRIPRNLQSKFFLAVLAFTHGLQLRCLLEALARVIPVRWVGGFVRSGRSTPQDERAPEASKLDPYRTQVVRAPQQINSEGILVEDIHVIKVSSVLVLVDKAGAKDNGL